MKYPLIGPDDPPPFSVHNPLGSARVLIVCDHASRAFPRAMNQLGLAHWVLDHHAAWDIGSGALARALSENLDASAILAGYSRLLVDTNRRLDHPTAFPDVSDGVAVPGNLDLTDAQKRLRIRSFFEPYHAAIHAKLDELGANDVTPAMISVHSCTPVFDRVVRRWHIGVLSDKDRRIADPLIEKLDALDEVCVGDNEPYSGQHPYDFTIDSHAEARGIPHVAIELRQDLIADEPGVRKWADILSRALEDTLADRSLYNVLASKA